MNGVHAAFTGRDRRPALRGVGARVRLRHKHLSRGYRAARVLEHTVALLQALPLPTTLGPGAVQVVRQEAARASLPLIQQAHRTYLKLHERAVAGPAVSRWLVTALQQGAQRTQPPARPTPGGP
jgi:hypothetical protein